MKRLTMGFAIWMACASAAGDAALDRATMRGLKAVGVVIDHVDPQLPRDGVTGDSLRGRLEARLKDAKIPVEAGAPEFVGLQITAVRGGKGPYAVSYTIGLYQQVALKRDAAVKTVTKTWEVETILMADPKTLVQ